MEATGTSQTSTEIDKALAVVMYENACDREAATCALAGSALSQRLSMEEVAAVIVHMASGSAAATVGSAR